jgi:hypothetical protein
MKKRRECGLICARQRRSGTPESDFTIRDRSFSVFLGWGLGVRGKEGKGVGLRLRVGDFFLLFRGRTRPRATNAALVPLPSKEGTTLDIFKTLT